MIVFSWTLAQNGIRVLSFASAMPAKLYVNFGTNTFDTYNNVSHSFTMDGCGTTNTWTVLSGNCLTVENCTATIVDGKMGIVELEDSAGALNRKIVRLMVNISEET